MISPLQSHRLVRFAIPPIDMEVVLVGAEAFAESSLGAGTDIGAVSPLGCGAEASLSCGIEAVPDEGAGTEAAAELLPGAGTSHPEAVG